MRLYTSSILLILIILFSWSDESKVNIPGDTKFNVYRNSSLIGFHNLSFSKLGDDIKAEIEIKFEVSFLGFVVYDYYHKNIEIWSKDKLKTLDTFTDKNGEELSCKVEKSKNMYKISGSSREILSDETLIPTSYWRNELIKGVEKKTLNTQDCSIINFKIESLGEKMIYNNKIKTDHYKLEGKESTGEDVIIDIWYDKFGRWVKMIFIKDGSEIEYISKKFDKSNE